MKPPGLLYIPIGNPAPNFTNAVRVGDNLYANSILVLDAKTGIYRAHYQLVPADFRTGQMALSGGKRKDHRLRLVTTHRNLTHGTRTAYGLDTLS